MRAALAVALVAIALLDAPLRAQTPHSDAARFLRSFVHLTITDDHGDTAKQSPVPIRAVDVNGLIRVSFDAGALADYLPAAAGAVGGDTTGRRLILALLDDLASYGRIAGALAASASRDSIAFNAARDSAFKWFHVYTEDVFAFFRHQVRLVDSTAATLELRTGQAANPYMGPDSMGKFTRYLRSEFARLLREAERAESSPVGLLTLQAWRLTPGGDSVRVALQGYDSATAERTTLVAKVTTVMSAEENASNAFHQELAGRVKNVGDVFDEALTRYRVLAADARTAVVGMAAAIEQTSEVARALLRQPDALVNAVPDSAKAAARQVVADIRGVADWVSGVLLPIRTLREDLRSISTGQQTPFALLSAVTEGLDSAKVASVRLRQLPSLVRTLASHARELGLKLPSVEQLTLPDTLATALNAAAAAYDRLRGVLDRAKDLIPHDRNVEAVAASFNEDWIPQLRLTPRGLASAPETEILLTTAGGDRADGDLLVFRADLLDPDRTSIGMYRWTFRIEKLNLSSRFAAGVGFSGRLARGKSDDILRPVPLLAWVLRDHKRGESGKQRLWNFVDPSPGVHIITFNGSTQAVQLGVGASLNLFHDFAQFGFGRKLQPENTDDRYYWYFGFGLFKLAKLGQ